MREGVPGSTFGGQFYCSDQREEVIVFSVTIVFEKVVLRCQACGTVIVGLHFPWSSAAAAVGDAAGGEEGSAITVCYVPVPALWSNQ